jgi:hypothetical protein
MKKERGHDQQARQQPHAGDACRHLPVLPAELDLPGFGRGDVALGEFDQSGLLGSKNATPNTSGTTMIASPTVTNR